MRRKPEPPAHPAPLPDEPARRAIAEDLGTTLLVEAAAGTGKTKSLVDRMTALVATGATTVDRLSAVTFTIRAAAQLRQRFQNALEDALRQEQDTARRGRITTALSGIDSCFVGTIHAFAARLLRERPVEAGLDPRFEEMDEPEDGVARNEAWDRFTESLFFGEDPRLARLIELGIPLEDLREAFGTLCENPDVDVEAGTRGPEPDFAKARREIEVFLDRVAASLPREAPPGGWSKFQEAVRRGQRLRELLDLERGPDFVRVLRALKPSSAAEGAAAAKKALERLREEVIKPSLAAWAEHVYPDVMAVLLEARDRYADWRRDQGRLNFQDLLLLARDLLREHPAVREDLRRRFTPILVDEFQDTDPIQAEILFYLTGSDSRQRDWRRLEPEPGSLFVVGDPKQSIYRFRRADIQTYQIVRDRIARCGRVLELSTNFRSDAALCDWVNGAFRGAFPARPTPQSPAYVALAPDPNREERQDGPAVFRIDIRVPGRGNQPVIDDDAGRIAGFIAAAVGKGQRRPGDFLLLFRKRRYMADYARALEDRGIPCELGGGDAFGDSEELSDLLTPLEALADPDNPVPLLAALRGPFFGIDDAALYRFARAGGRFSFRSETPPETDPRIRRAYEILRSGEQLAERLPPAAAISRFAEGLGAVALAASRRLGESRAGNLLKAFAAARKLSAAGLDFSAVIGELGRLREESLIEQMSVEPGRPDAVRLLTLHGAKGLEAPVVFLAEPATRSGAARGYWIDRDADPSRGFFRVVKHVGDHGVEEIARPPGWERMEDLEEEFDRAENKRLLYVGATRAREMLVVSVRRSKDETASGTWADLAPRIAADLPQPALAAPPEATPSRDLSAELSAFRARRDERRARAAAPTLAAASVTDLAHAAGAAPERERTGRGMEWGRIIHGLLEAVMRDPSVDVRRYAENLFAEEERPEVDLEEAVRRIEAVRDSPLWRRALAARHRLVEVPFGLMVESRELGLEEGPAETLLTGAIDLLFEEEDGWTLVDYKSDRITGNLPALVAFYEPQIRHYRRYWQRLTGRPTRAGLFFVETGEEAWLPEG